MGITKTFSNNTNYLSGNDSTDETIFGQGTYVFSEISDVYHKILEFTLRSAYGDNARLYITFTLAGVGGAGTFGARIYVNDVAVGTERTTAASFSEVITLATAPVGTRIQIYAKGNGAAIRARIVDLTVKANTSYAERTFIGDES